MSLNPSAKDDNQEMEMMPDTPRARAACDALIEEYLRQGNLNEKQKRLLGNLLKARKS